MKTVQPSRNPAYALTSKTPLESQFDGSSARSSRFNSVLARSIRPLLTAALLLTAFSAAHCATQSWNANGDGTGGSGTWDTGSTPDWDSGVVWTDSNDALFSGTGGVVTVVNPIADSVNFNATGPYTLTSGTLTLSGGGISVSGSATIASAIEFQNNLSTSGAGSLTLTGSTDDLSNGYWYDTLATASITGGGAVSVGYETLIGYAGTASVMVSGSGSELSGGSAVVVGAYGNGNLSVTNGGTVVGFFGYLGYNGSGAATISGSGSVWTSGELNVGQVDGGQGMLLVSNGGTASAGIASIGHGAGTSGTATVTGFGSTLIDSEGLYIGNAGSGTLAISIGASVSNSNGWIGYAAGSSGSATVDGAGSAWTNNGTLYVGESGSGSLSITNGALVSSSSGAIIGDQAGSVGSATVTGTRARWINGGDLYIGNSGTGMLLISDGGAVTSHQSIDGAVVGGTAGSIGSVTGGNGLTLTDTALEVNGNVYIFTLANSTADDEVLTVSVAAVPGDESHPFAYREGAKSDVPGSSHASAPLIGTTAVPEPENWASAIAALAAMMLLPTRPRGRKSA